MRRILTLLLTCMAGAASAATVTIIARNGQVGTVDVGIIELWSLSDGSMQIEYQQNRIFKAGFQ